MSLLFVCTFVFCCHIGRTATRYWDGGGTTRNWSEAANWEGDRVPVPGDEIIFDTEHIVIGGSADSVVDRRFDFWRLTTASNYTGTITVNAFLKSTGSNTLNNGTVVVTSTGAIRTAVRLHVEGNTSLQVDGGKVFVVDQTNFGGSARLSISNGGMMVSATHARVLGSARVDLSGGTFSVGGTLDLRDNATMTMTDSAQLRLGARLGTSANTSFTAQGTNSTTFPTITSYDADGYTVALRGATDVRGLVFQNTAGTGVTLSSPAGTSVRFDSVRFFYGQSGAGTAYLTVTGSAYNGYTFYDLGFSKRNGQFPRYAVTTGAGLEIGISGYLVDAADPNAQNPAGSTEWMYEKPGSYTRASPGVYTLPGAGSTVTWSGPRPNPVVLKYLRAQTDGRLSLVTWATASERDCRGFAVERSDDGGRRFSPVAAPFTPGLGASLVGGEYAVLDPVAPGRQTVYRLVERVISGRRIVYGLPGVPPERVSALDAKVLARARQATAAAYRQRAEYELRRRLRAASSRETEDNSGDDAAASYSTVAARRREGKVAVIASRITNETGQTGSAGLGPAVRRAPAEEVAQLTSLSPAGGGEGRLASSTGILPVSSPPALGERPLSAHGRDARAAATARGVADFVGEGWRLTTRAAGVFAVNLPGLNQVPGPVALSNRGRFLVPLWRSADGESFWFYAESYQDQYTDTNVYWVGNFGERGMRQRAELCRAPASLPQPRSWPRRRLPGKAETTAATVVLEKNEYYLWSYPVAGVPAYYFPKAENLVSGTVRSYTLVVPHPARAGEARLRLAMLGYSSEAGLDPDHRIEVRLNGQRLGEVTFDGLGYYVGELRFEGGLLAAGENRLELETPYLAGGVAQESLLDRVELVYRRQLVLEGGALAFAAPRLSWVEIAAPGEGELALLEVKQERLLSFAVSGAGAGRRVGFFALRGGEYLLFASSAVGAPAGVEYRKLEALPAEAEFLLVAPGSFLGAYQPLLAQRRSEGLNGVFVDYAQVIDVVGWGIYGPGPIREYVGRLRPKYLLLGSETDMDYRGYLAGQYGPPPAGYLVPAFLEPSADSPEVVSDLPYGDLDGDGLPEMAVGRLPAQTAGEVTTMVGRVLSGPVYPRKVVLVADRNDAENDFRGVQERLAAELGDFEVVKLYRDQLSREALRAALFAQTESDAGLVIYQGHGAQRFLAKDGLVYWVDPPRFGARPVLFAGTCYSAHYAFAPYESLAERMLRSVRGGTAAYIGATYHSTTPEAGKFSRLFLGELRKGGRVRLGEAYYRALRGLEGRRPEERAIALNYHLLGDPTMPVLIEPATAPVPAPPAPKQPQDEF